MKQHCYWTILIGLLILLSTGTAIVSAGLILPDPNANAPDNGQIRSTMLTLPLSFIENQGQAPDDVKFHVAAAGHTISFTPDGLVLRTTQEKEDNPVTAEVRMDFAGTASDPVISGLDQLPGTANFFIGNDASKWQEKVPTFASVRYNQLYPGIDLVYKGTEGVLKREFVVAPGAEPGRIAIEYTGIDSLALADDGSLLITTPLGVLTDEAPVAYQVIDGIQTTVQASYYLLDKSTVGFNVGEYNPAYPLVIDPTLIYSTYLGGGGTGYEYGYGIAVDGQKAIYVTGSTASSSFPTKNPIYPSNAGSDDIFITKINPSGTALDYSTYIGTSQSDYGYAIAIDGDGNAYVTGMSNNITVFPRINPVPDLVAYGTGSTTNQGAYFLKLNPTGSAILFSSTWGASGSNTCGKGIAVDQMHHIYIGGYATAPDGIPMVYPIQGSINGNVDGFVLKIAPDGLSVLNSTFFGGTAADYISGIAVDPAGNVYITGDTVSTVNFPLINPIQSFGGVRDAFVAKINSDWSSLAYSTYLGGTGTDLGSAIAVDPSGAVYLCGVAGAGFPLVNPAQGTLSGTADNFVTKINPAGTALVYSTYWGSSGSDSGFKGIAADASGNAYVTGSVAALNGPIVNPIQSWGGGSSDNIVMKLGPTGTIIYATPLGGNGLETGYAITADDLGNAYVLGNTASTNFPLKNPVQGIFGGGRDVYVAVISPLSPPVANFTAAPLSGISPLNVQFTDSSTGSPTSWNWSFGDSTPNSSAQSPLHTYSSAGNFTVILTATNGAGSSSLAKTQYINVTAPTPTIRFEPTSPVIAVGGTQHYELIVSTLPSGLAGFNLTLSLANPSVGRITGFTPAGWMALNGSSTLPATSLTFNGVDLGRAVEPGATNVSIGTIDVQGLSPGATAFNIAVQKMDADGGAAINPAVSPATLTVYQPLAADFSGDHTVGIETLLVNFTDLTSGSPSPASWMWTFGDSSFATSQNPSHTYTAVGRYNVTLTVSNAYCGSTVTKNAYIVVRHYVEPFPGYTVPPTDTDNDGLCEDVNGNGRLDFDDVVAFYVNMDWIRANTSVGVAPFDFNGNGRIDYDDVVVLYLEVLNG